MTGVTIQIGLGKMADMVAVALKEKHDLGLHTELYTPGIGDLICCGAINGGRKIINRSRQTCGRFRHRRPGPVFLTC